jgi:hypothetical protein
MRARTAWSPWLMPAQRVLGETKAVAYICRQILRNVEVPQ